MFIINNNIIGWGFCDIWNNQGQGKCYQPKPKAEADNTNRDDLRFSNATGILQKQLCGLLVLK